MNVYVWKSVYGLTSEYHDGGGLLVVADEPPIAIDGWKDGEKASIDLPKPDETWPLAGKHCPQTIVFPDSGCC